MTWFNPIPYCHLSLLASLVPHLREFAKVLTTATGSLLRVAARLKFFTCVLVSRAFANSFSVGIGMFLN